MKQRIKKLHMLKRPWASHMDGLRSLDPLILENCLLCGQNSRFTAPNVSHYLFGTRATREIFKLYELRYLLLRLPALIQTLFRQARVELQLEVMKKKQESVVQVLQANLPPQILFASITPAFADIISHAAKICNMPSHQQRWLNGSITGAISYLSDQQLWANGVTRTSKQIQYFFRQRWSQNKENWAKSEENARYYNRSRWPSLVIIPDIANNHMILAEIKKIGLPVMGLVNSNCAVEIEYPLFAQDQSFASVHFFCHFLAILIAKEMTFWQHKAHIKKKSGSQKQLSKPFVSRSSRTASQNTDVMDSFFFNLFLPLQNRTRPQPLNDLILDDTDDTVNVDAALRAKDRAKEKAKEKKKKKLAAQLAVNKAKIQRQMAPYFAWLVVQKKNARPKKLATLKWLEIKLRRTKKTRLQATNQKILVKLRAQQQKEALARQMSPKMQSRLKAKRAEMQAREEANRQATMKAKMQADMKAREEARQAILEAKMPPKMQSRLKAKRARMQASAEANRQAKEKWMLREKRREERKATREKMEARREKMREKMQASMQARRRLLGYWQQSQTLSLWSTPHLRHLGELRRQIRRQKMLFGHFLQEEEKTKWLAKKRHPLPAVAELKTKWLRHFLWLPKETRLFWQQQLFWQNENDFLSTSYHWVSVSHFQREQEWPIYQHMFRSVVFDAFRIRKNWGKIQEHLRRNWRPHFKMKPKHQVVKKPWSKWKKKEPTSRQHNFAKAARAAKAKVQKKVQEKKPQRGMPQSRPQAKNSRVQSAVQSATVAPTSRVSGAKRDASARGNRKVGSSKSRKKRQFTV